MKKYTDLGLIIFDIIFTIIFLTKEYWIFGAMSMVCAICESVNYYLSYFYNKSKNNTPHNGETEL